MSIKTINEAIKIYVIELIGSNNENYNDSIIYKYIDKNLGLNNINTDGTYYKQVNELFKNINIELEELEELDKIKEINNFDDFNFLYEIFETILNIYLFFLDISDFSIKKYKITSNKFNYNKRYLYKDFNYLLNILDYDINENVYQAKMNKLYTYDLVRADYKPNSVKNVFKSFIDKYTEFVNNLFKKLSNLLNHIVFKKYGLSNITKYIKKDYLNNLKDKVQAKNLIIDTLISEYLLNPYKVDDNKIKFILNVYKIPFYNENQKFYDNFIDFLNYLNTNLKFKSNYIKVIKDAIQQNTYKVYIFYCGNISIKYVIDNNSIDNNSQVSFIIIENEIVNKVNNCTVKFYDSVKNYINSNTDNSVNNIFGRLVSIQEKTHILKSFKLSRNNIYELKSKIKKILQIIEPINYKIGNIISLLENCK